MRLDALLSRFGYCSRREAISWIKRHTITYKGELCTSPSQKVTHEETIIDGEHVEFPNGIYVALYKPVGYICSHDEEEGDIIYDLLPYQWRHRNPAISSVGRLDKDTSGLLFITDDGKFIHRMTSPKKHIPKIYEVETENPIPAEAVELFASGTLQLEGERQVCRPAELIITDALHARIILTEGKYHQVRRMFAAVGAPVVKLHRPQIGNLTIESLELEQGEWVAFDPNEL